MIDALMKHQYDLKRLNLDVEYLKKRIFKELKGKDGFGPNTKEHLKIWHDTLYESLESFEQVYSNILQIIQNI